MMAKWILAAAGAAFLAGTPAVAADDADNSGDMKCMIVGMMLAGNADPKIAQSGQMTAIYFLGRLDGRAPKLDLQTQMIAQGQTMKPDEIKSVAISCGQMLQARGQALTAISQAADKAGAPPPPSLPPAGSR